MYGVEGLPEKIKDLKFDFIFKSDKMKDPNYIEPNWKDEIDYVFLEGNEFFNEITFFHKKS